ncbi:hypothetical protein ADJ73_02445 [Arsenicicoccus sp. oral taxon 190]|nr:hypothetical protein ADJ73_02445 [Arsenicicoccus sp. oral taxon 190]
MGSVLLALALAGCGGTGPAQPTTSSPGTAAGQSPATSATTSPGASPTGPAQPTTPGGTMTSPLVPSHDVSDSGKPAPLRTVTGTVSAGVEAGCLVLTSADGREVLQPLGGGLKVGDHVTVEGRDARGVATTCQQGMPFQVTRVVSHDD